MTLHELKELVEVADAKVKIPTAKSLRNSSLPIVIEKNILDQGRIAVYANGFVLYEEGNRCTVFRLHSCGDYMYLFEGSTLQSQQQISEQYFDSLSWEIRLIMEGADRLARNQEQRIIENHQYSTESQEEFEDRSLDFLDRLIMRETLRGLCSQLTDRQRQVLRLHFIEGYSQTEIASILSIRQQSVSEHLHKGIKTMKKFGMN